MVAGPALWPTIGWIALAVFVQATLGRLLAFHGAIPALVMIPLGAGTLGRGFFSDGFLIQGFLVALAVALRDLVYWTLERFEGFPHGLGLVHLHVGLIQAALTGLLTIVYLVVRERFVADRTSVERYP